MSTEFVDDEVVGYGVLGTTGKAAADTSITCFGVMGAAVSASADIQRLKLELLANSTIPQPIWASSVERGGGHGRSVPAAGVFGVSTLGVNTAGVAGENDETGGIGVIGASLLGDGVVGTSGSGSGIRGHSDTGRAIWGFSESFIATVGDSSSGTGIWGHSITGTGVYGEGKQYGVYGKSNSGSAIYGEQTEGGDGVTGRSQNGTGVAGISSRANGIYGRCDAPEFGKAGYFEGDVTVTGDICLGNADCAEDFDVVDIDDATPGTVMVLYARGMVRASDQPYDTRVAGVVSGAGGFKPGIILDRRKPGPNRQPLALLGKVYCKVDARYGSIVVGDLLTTSATPGHAMKATNREKAFGAVIGKALDGLTEGTGLIPVLVGLR